MSDSGKGIFPDFGKLVPGFDFLQNLTRQASASAGSGMPQMPKLGSWVAPTLSVEEIDKRIEELKAVQFWLDQNATALKATIQALEVQKMTLSALQGMNVNMAEMAKAFQVPDASGLASGMNAASSMASNIAATMTSMSGKSANTPAAGTADKPHHHFEGLEVPETSFARREARQSQSGSKAQPASQHNGHDAHSSSAAQEPGAEAAKAAAGMAAVIDPLQWWGALTQQFQTIANSAMQEAQRHPFEAGQAMASDAVRSASKAASELARNASQTLAKSANTARDLMTGALTDAGAAKPGRGKRAEGSAKAATQAGSGRSAASKSTGRSTGKAAAQAAGKAPGKAGKAPAKGRASSAKAPTSRTTASRKVSARAR